MLTIVIHFNTDYGRFPLQIHQYKKKLFILVKKKKTKKKIKQNAVYFRRKKSDWLEFSRKNHPVFKKKKKI